MAPGDEPRRIQCENLFLSAACRLLELSPAMVHPSGRTPIDPLFHPFPHLWVAVTGLEAAIAKERIWAIRADAPMRRSLGERPLCWPAPPPFLRFPRVPQTTASQPRGCSCPA